MSQKNFSENIKKILADLFITSVALFIFVQAAIDRIETYRTGNSLFPILLILEFCFFMLIIVLLLFLIWMHLRELVGKIFCPIHLDYVEAPKEDNRKQCQEQTLTEEIVANKPGVEKLAYRQLGAIETELGVFLRNPKSTKRCQNQQFGIYGEEGENHLGDVMADGHLFTDEELRVKILALLTKG